MRHQLTLSLDSPPEPRAPAAQPCPTVKLGELLILSCSATKRPGFTVGHFSQLYAGPLWQDVRRSGFPWSRVAAISASYGFLEPTFPAILEPYNVQMDDEASARICGTSDHVARLAACVQAHGSAFVVGGELYRRVARAAERYRPELGGRISYATGTYLEQRKQLGMWLRAQLTTQGV